MGFTHKLAHSRFKSNIQIIPDKIADYTNIGEGNTPKFLLGLDTDAVV